MGKNRLCRLLGVLLAMVLTITAVMAPVYASETEAVGSAESIIAEEIAPAEHVEEAESIDPEAISDEGEAEVVEEDAFVVTPDDTDESLPDYVPDESSLSDSTESGVEGDESGLAASELTDSEIVSAETESSLAADEEMVGATISEGLYFIESALSSSVCLVVANGSMSNNANIRLSNSVGNYAQAFYVKSNGKGGYYLQNYHTGLRVVVANGSTANGANVQQYKATSAVSQEWYAVKGSKSGYYQFRNGSASGKAMEVAGSVAKAGTNVQINAAKSSALNQQWKLVPVYGKVLNESRLVNSNLKNGYYSFASVDASSRVFEVTSSGTADKTNIRLANSGFGKGQVFEVTSLGSNLYSIINPYSGKALTAASTSVKDGVNIYQYTYSGTTAQKWYIKKDSTTGNYVITNYKASHVALGTKGGAVTAGTNIQNVTFTGAKGQYWTIKSRTEADAFRLGNGVYAINSALSSSRDMQIEGASVYNNAAVEIAASAAKNEQRYVVNCSDKNNFVYTIVCQNSRKYVGVSGSKVIQTSSNSTNATKWVIKHSGAGYTLQCLGNSKNIVVPGASTASGTNLEVASPGSSKAQRWVFKPASVVAPAARAYTIRTAGVFKYALHIKGGSFGNNGNVVIYTINNSTNIQKFSLIANSDGTYYIANVHSGKVLDTYGAKTASGTNAVQYGKSSRATQKWKLVPTGDADGSYYIVSSGGTALSLEGSSYTNFANMCVLTKNNAKKQKFILVPSDPTDGWRTTTSGKRSYYINGAAAKSKWVQISGKYYYFDSNGVLVVNSVVDGYTVDANGARGATVASNTDFKTTINGKKTLTSYLHNALVPAGRTLYIWGGGWGGDTAENNDAMKIGYLSSWQEFYNKYATSGYDYTKYRYKYFAGLDCSGFAGWTLYNTLFTKNDQDYVVFQSTTVAPTYIKKGWATQVTTYRPGDVVSMDGHVWISLGTCSDKSILLVHSSPKGVQISGTGGVATTLATKYMKILAPKWPYAIRTVGSGYTSNVTIARWIVNGKGTLTDPDGLQNMSAEQVMKFLFGQ